MTAGVRQHPPAPTVLAQPAGPREALLPSAYEASFEGFDGHLIELAAALRAGRLLPAQVPLARLAREVLQRYLSARETLGLDAAAEALPHLAAVIELKARLLLPAPPGEAGPDDWSGTDEADEPLGRLLEGIEALARLENAIEFLRGRRQERARLITPPPAQLEWPRRQRPLGKGLGDLVAAARRRVRTLDLGQLTLERLTIKDALERLRALASQLRRFVFREAPAEGWPERTVLFAALLEGVKSGELDASQAEPFGDIEVRAGTRSRAAPQEIET